MDDMKAGLSVTAAESGQKLLNFLRRRVDAQDGELHRWIRTGQVRVDGRRAKAFDRVEQGEIVRVPPFASVRKAETEEPDCVQERAVPPELPPIVHEDQDILVLAKPAGLPSQGGTGHADSAASRVARAFAGACFVPAPAHRLDRDTTGLLVFGKTYRSLRFLTDAFAGRGAQRVRKDYLAWVDGRWESQTAELRDLLVRDGQTRLMRVCGRNDPQETPAGAVEARLLAFPLLERRIEGRMRTLLLLRLLTGRTHQIRAQLSSRGHPVSGDPWYGSGGRLKLHAFRIILPTPDGRSMALELPPPWGGPWQVTDPALDAARKDPFSDWGA